MASEVVAFRKREESSLLSTHVFERVTFALRYCQTHAVMGTVLGSSGVGKTMAFRNYAATNQRVLHVALKNRRTTQFQLALLIAEAMKFRLSTTERTREVYRIERAIEDNFAFGGLIIIDECHWLAEKTSDWLRSTQESRNVGMVLGGNREPAKMFGQGADDELAQLASRIPMRVDIHKVSEEDFTLFFDHHKVVGVQSRTKLMKLAERDGNFRTLQHIVDFARELADGAKVLDARCIDNAIRLLGH